MEEGRENDKEIESISKVWQEVKEMIRIAAEVLKPAEETVWKAAMYATKIWIEMPAQKRRKLLQQYYKKKAEMKNNERRRRKMPMVRRPKRQQWAGPHTGGKRDERRDG